VVLKTLGVVDYGIYNVVGGIVIMFSFLSNTMALASQRFFSFLLGKQDLLQLNRTFNMSIFIYLIIDLVIILLAETIGLWFLNTKMVIPPERMVAANWIYQFAILSLVITLLTTPYNAIIIAHEKMGVYAIMSIIEVSLKLGVVYVLVLLSYDKLKLYAVLTFTTTCLIGCIYFIYCKIKYEETHLKFYWDLKLFKEILNFSGWTLFGTISGLANDQGNNILINIFFGPKVNAARAIAFQINSAVSSFASNFFTALRPPLTKSYAENNFDYMIKLFYMSSKLSYFMLLLLSLPIMIETKYILSLWLSHISNYMVIFTRLILIYTLVISLQNPITTLVHATGKIKKYHVIIDSITLLCLPLSYLFLKLGYSPEYTLYISIIIFSIVHFIRIWLLRELVNFSIKSYLSNVLLVIIVVTFASIIPLLFFEKLFIEGFVKLIVVSFVSCILVLINSYFFGLSKTEKLNVDSYILTILQFK
jgi:O-antigen/teichoic acid export membrane protein